jgi:hypothetical protein
MPDLWPENVSPSLTSQAALRALAGRKDDLVVRLAPANSPWALSWLWRCDRQLRLSCIRCPTAPDLLHSGPANPSRLKLNRKLCRRQVQSDERKERSRGLDQVSIVNGARQNGFVDWCPAWFWLYFELTTSPKPPGGLSFTPGDKILYSGSFLDFIKTKL